jgi:hypothetical protein
MLWNDEDSEAILNGYANFIKAFNYINKILKRIKIGRIKNYTVLLIRSWGSSVIWRWVTGWMIGGSNPGRD